VLQGQVAQLQAQGEVSAHRLRAVESDYEHKLSSAMGGWPADCLRAPNPAPGLLAGGGSQGPHRAACSA
jgi:hypothetical protein